METNTAISPSLIPRYRQTARTRTVVGLASLSPTTCIANFSCACVSQSTRKYCRILFLPQTSTPTTTTQQPHNHIKTDCSRLIMKLQLEVVVCRLPSIRRRRRRWRTSNYICDSSCVNYSLMCRQRWRIHLPHPTSKVSIVTVLANITNNHSKESWSKLQYNQRRPSQESDTNFKDQGRELIKECI